MTKVLFLFLVLAVWCAPVESAKLQENPETRMVGGSLAPVGSVKYMVSLRTDYNRHFCGGTIIADSWILTSASCLYDRPLRAIIAVTGTVSRQRGCGFYTLDQNFIYSGYSEKLRIHDIGLLRTKETIKFSSIVQAISLPGDTDKAKEGETATIAGFGSVNQDANQYQDPLRWMKVKIISLDQCRKTYSDQTILDKQLCTLVGPKKGGCDGDIGGGLVLGDEVVGVMSWVTRCGRGKPDVYTRVIKYKDWIQKIMASNKK